MSLWCHSTYVTKKDKYAFPDQFMITNIKVGRVDITSHMHVCPTFYDNVELCQEWQLFRQ